MLELKLIVYFTISEMLHQIWYLQHDNTQPLNKYTLEICNTLGPHNSGLGLYFLEKQIIVKCHYNAVQYNTRFHTVLHWLKAEYENMKKFKLTKDTPYLILMGKLWGVYCEDFGENWLHYSSTSLQYDLENAGDGSRCLGLFSSETQTNMTLKMQVLVLISWWPWSSQWALLLTWLNFNPAWISNHTPSKVWGETTYPFQTSTVQMLKLEMDK